MAVWAGPMFPGGPGCPHPKSPVTVFFRPAPASPLGPAELLCEGRRGEGWEEMTLDLSFWARVRASLLTSLRPLSESLGL